MAKLVFPEHTNQHSIVFPAKLKKDSHQTCKREIEYVWAAAIINNKEHFLKGCTRPIESHLQTQTATQQLTMDIFGLRDQILGLLSLSTHSTPQSLHSTEISFQTTANALKANARMLYDPATPLEVITQTQIQVDLHRIWMVIVMSKTPTGCTAILLQSEPNVCLITAYNSLLVATSDKLTEMIAQKYLQAIDQGTYPCSCGVEACAANQHDEVEMEEGRDEGKETARHVKRQKVQAQQDLEAEAEMEAEAQMNHVREIERRHRLSEEAQGQHQQAQAQGGAVEHECHAGGKNGASGFVDPNAGSLI